MAHSSKEYMREYMRKSRSKKKITERLMQVKETIIENIPSDFKPDIEKRELSVDETLNHELSLLGDLVAFKKVSLLTLITLDKLAMQEQHFIRNIQNHNDKLQAINKSIIDYAVELTHYWTLVLESPNLPIELKDDIAILVNRVQNLEKDIKARFENYKQVRAALDSDDVPIILETEA